MSKKAGTEISLPCFWPFTIGGIVELKLSWLCREKETNLSKSTTNTQAV